VARCRPFVHLHQLLDDQALRLTFPSSTPIGSFGADHATIAADIEFPRPEAFAIFQAKSGTGLSSALCESSRTGDMGSPYRRKRRDQSIKRFFSALIAPLRPVKGFLDRWGRSDGTDGVSPRAPPQQNRRKSCRIQRPRGEGVRRLPSWKLHPLRT